MSTESAAARRLDFRSVAVKSALLTPLVQWLYLVAMSLFSRPNKFVCTNWHGEMLECTTASALFGNILNVVLINVFTLGLALVIAFGVTLLVVSLIELYLPAVVKRSGAFWIGVVCAFVLVIVGRVEQIRDLRAARFVERSGAQPIVIIKGSGGGAVTFDPRPATPSREAAGRGH